MGYFIQSAHCISSFRTQTSAEIIYIQVNMFLHDRNIHFLSMLPNEWKGFFRMVERVGNGLSEASIDLFLY